MKKHIPAIKENRQLCSNKNKHKTTGVNGRTFLEIL